MSSAPMEFAVDGTLATIRLSHPERKNAISAEMRAAFRMAIDRLSDGDDQNDLDVRALLISAEGDTFCSGGDIKDMGRSRTNAMVRNRVIKAQHWFSRLINLEMPVVVAVNGPAIGAGFSLALAGDFILASKRARFSCAFGKVGLMPDLSLMYLLPRMIGLQRAKELVFSTRVIDAQEARDIGLVYDVVAEDELEDASRELALKLTKAPPVAIGLSKVLLNRSFEMDQRAMVEFEALAQVVAVGSESHQAAVASFMQKRPFDYVGVDRPSRMKTDAGK